MLYILRPCHVQVVILIGGGSSALDISMEIAHVAKEVHVASRSTKVGALGNLSGYDNLKLHSTVKVIKPRLWYMVIEGSGWSELGRE